MVGLCAAAGFSFSAAFMRSRADERRDAAHSDASKEPDGGAGKLTPTTVVRQMLRHRNFGIFTLVSALQASLATTPRCGAAQRHRRRHASARVTAAPPPPAQVFECTLEKNFLSFFIDALLSDASKHTRRWRPSTRAGAPTKPRAGVGRASVPTRGNSRGGRRGSVCINS